MSYLMSLIVGVVCIIGGENFFFYRVWSWRIQFVIFQKYYIRRGKMFREELEFYDCIEFLDQSCLFIVFFVIRVN